MKKCEKSRVRKILLVSVKFLSAILGPEMGASILWTPGKMRSFCRKTHVHKIPRFRGGVFWVFGGGSADFIFMGARIFSEFFRPKFFHGRPRGMSVPKCLLFPDLEGLAEVFGGLSAGMSGPKLPLWAEFSFLNNVQQMEIQRMLHGKVSTLGLLDTFYSLREGQNNVQLMVSGEFSELQAHPNLHSPAGVQSSGGRPQRGGTNLGVFVPRWPVITPASS